MVSGKVQGVWYRVTTQQKALELGLTGSAINLPDGRVEVIACGDADQVESLCAWLWQGSPLSEVSGVECKPIAPQNFSDFSTG